MKILKFGLLIFIATFLSSCSSTLNIIKYTIPQITDTKIFPADTVSKSDTPFSFVKVENQELPPAFLWTIGKSVRPDISTEEFLERNATTAFIVIRNDTILYENYFSGYSRDNYTQVFSITKSVVSALVGIAQSEGLMNIDQPVSDFLPYFNLKGRESVTINHLLQMTSGLAFNDYTTLGKLLNLYYSKNQEQIIRKVKMKQEPGVKFAYKSIATQILGMCLEVATGQRIADYLEDKLWGPLGMEYDATLALEDNNGIAKMYGGLTASAIDLAKLGRLYLNNGNWNGKQIIPEQWVQATRTADTTNGCSIKYSYCWWLDTYPRSVDYCSNDLFAGGFRGQVIYVNPDNNTVIVRIGKKENGVEWPKSMSKLALLNDKDNTVCELSYASLEGKYQNKAGKSFVVKWLNDMLILEDFEVPGKIELKRDTNISFINREKQLKVIVDYKDQHIKGLFLENKDEAEFLIKI